MFIKVDASCLLFVDISISITAVAENSFDYLIFALQVRAVELETVLTKGAYMLFYAR